MILLSEMPGMQTVPASINVREIRELAKKFTVEQIEECITQEVGTGRNICLMNGRAEAVIDELAKAEFVRERMDGGMSLADAIRALAKQMRLLKKGYEE